LKRLGSEVFSGSFHRVYYHDVYFLLCIGRLDAAREERNENFPCCGERFFKPARDAVKKFQKDCRSEGDDVFRV